MEKKDESGEEGGGAVFFLLWMTLKDLKGKK